MLGRGASLQIVLAAALGLGQWLDHPTPDIPRTRDGRPNLAAPAPRGTDGKPDLSGIWQVESTPREEMERLFGRIVAPQALGDDPGTFSKYMLDILADVPQRDSLLLPEAANVAKKRRASFRTDRPMANCLPAGVPAVELLPRPFRIVHTPKYIAMLHEGDGTFRQMHLDGRKHPTDPTPTWLGYSVGKWEGDTLIVDTQGFNGKTWLDTLGHGHSDALRVQERFHRRDFGHLDVDVTIDDPKTFTKPFTIRFTERLVPDTEILEYFCLENSRPIQR
jgi:hypothetical protein